MKNQENIVLAVLLAIGLIIIGVIIINDEDIFKRNDTQTNTNMNNNHVSSEEREESSDFSSEETPNANESSASVNNYVVEDGTTNNSNNSNNTSSNGNNNSTNANNNNNTNNNECRTCTSNSSSNNASSSNAPTTAIYTANDQTAINEITEIEQETIALLNSNEKEETIADKAKGVFITLVDFVFYDADINGVTFDSLTDAGKEKVLELVSKIDGVIEQHFPGYKESISNTASKALNKASELIKAGAANIDAFSREKLGEENYLAMINAKDELVKYTKNAFSIIGEVGGNLISKAGASLKEWYENFRDSQ